MGGTAYEMRSALLMCFCTAIQGGLRVGLDVGKWLMLQRIVDQCWRLEAFRKEGARQTWEAGTVICSGEPCQEASELI